MRSQLCLTRAILFVRRRYLTIRKPRFFIYMSISSDASPCARAPAARRVFVFFLRVRTYIVVPDASAREPLFCEEEKLAVPRAVARAFAREECPCSRTLPFANDTDARASRRRLAL